MSYKNVWTLSEQEQGKLKEVSFELLKRGRALADKRKVELVAIVLGHNLDKDDLQKLIYFGADKVLVVDAPELEYFLTDPYVNVVTKLIENHKPEILIASATTTGRTVAPAVAIKVNTGLTADCTGLDIDDEGHLIQTRPAIGGNILATIKTPIHRPQMASVRPHSNQPLDIDKSRTGEIIYEEIDKELLKSRIKRIEFHENEEETGNIQDAEVIIAGGKGCKTEEKFKMIKEIATLMHGAVGGSREAVDLGWISYPHQIGLSGQTVSPHFYLVAGVSGAVQHLAGIKTAENIVAINNDPEAQIFQVADFGIQGDLNDILPVIINKLKERKEGK